MPPLASSHPALTPDPHSTPAHPFRKLDLLVSRKTSKGNVLVLRPDVHSWAPPPPTSCGFCWDFRPQGKGPSWGLAKPSQSGQPGPGGKGRLRPSGPTAPTSCHPGAGFMCKNSLWAAFQAAVPQAPPILPPPEGGSQIQCRPSRGSRESGNKGEESHFLSRGRKETAIQQPPTRRSFRLQPRAGPPGAPRSAPSPLPWPSPHPFQKLWNRL